MPVSEVATDISLTASGNTSNLLGSSWTFTPAPSGSDTNTFNDGYGTGTPAIIFAGVTVGSYDQYSQTIATSAGQSYTLNFLFTNASYPYNAPSGFIVTASNASVVPEPSGIALLGLATIMFAGYCGWRRWKLVAA